MKKQSRRVVKNYDVFKDYHFEYYGLLPKNSKLSVDVKRFLKQIYIYDKKIVGALKAPRNTAYFKPYKKKRYDYNFNIFKDAIDEIAREWEFEFKPMIEKIKTPEQVEIDEYSGDLASTGILEPDEVSIHARMQRYNRIEPYNKVVTSFYAQFYHHFASKIESVMLVVLKKNNFGIEFYTRKELIKFFEDNTNKDIKDLKTYKFYDQFYKVWNFLKHNSISAYKKLKEKYPEFLINHEENYENGDLAIDYVKISEGTILYFIEKPPIFFEELCKELFEEKTEQASWNYDDWFYEKVREYKELVFNPLGLPFWL